jgi:hypothetical protein
MSTDFPTMYQLLQLQLYTLAAIFNMYVCRINEIIVAIIIHNNSESQP